MGRGRRGADGGSASADAGIAAILTGMGNLSYGEMAGQRVKLGLILNDPEEEHDCFSDNTPQSHYFDLKGVENVYLGRYTRTDGTEISGPSLKDALAEADGALAQTLADEIGLQALPRQLTFSARWPAKERATTCCCRSATPRARRRSTRSSMRW